MPPILIVTLIVLGALALWFVIGLSVAPIIGRVGAAGEHQRRMDVLHRDVRQNRASASAHGKPIPAHGSSAGRAAR